jgi:hypothetical protein
MMEHQQQQNQKTMHNPPPLEKVTMTKTWLVTLQVTLLVTSRVTPAVLTVVTAKKQAAASAAGAGLSLELLQWQQQGQSWQQSTHWVSRAATAMHVWSF